MKPFQKAVFFQTLNRIRQQSEREILSLQRQLKIYQNQGKILLLDFCTTFISKDRQRRNETERVATEFHEFKIRYHDLETNLITVKIF